MVLSLSINTLLLVCYDEPLWGASIFHSDVAAAIACTKVRMACVMGRRSDPLYARGPCADSTADPFGRCGTGRVAVRRVACGVWRIKGWRMTVLSNSN